MKILEYLKEYVLNFFAVFFELAPWLLIGYVLAGFIAFLLTPEQVKRHLSGKGMKPILKAVLFGVPLPLCSCGIIPVAASIREEGASRGASGAFLVATPQTGIDSILVTWSMLGWGLAIFRPIFAFLTGLTGGFLIEKFCSDPNEEAEKVEAQKEEKEHHCCCCCHSKAAEKQEVVKEKRTLFGAVKFVLSYGFGKMLNSTSPSLFVGILLAALIEMVVPADFGASYINNNMALEFLIVTVIAIPLYVCSSASVPVAMALFLKGFSPGAVLIFLVAGPATNTVTIAAMKSMLGSKATIMTTAVIAFWAVVAGCFVNYLGIEIPRTEIFNHSHESDCCSLTWCLKVGATVIMAFFMGKAIILKKLKQIREKRQKTLNK